MSKKSWNYKPDGPKPIRRKAQDDDWKRQAEEDEDDE